MIVISYDVHASDVTISFFTPPEGGVRSAPLNSCLLLLGHLVTTLLHDRLAQIAAAGVNASAVQDHRLA
jgi:hypothetical protein